MGKEGGGNNVLVLPRASLDPMASKLQLLNLGCPANSNGNLEMLVLLYWEPWPHGGGEAGGGGTTMKQYRGPLPPFSLPQKCIRYNEISMVSEQVCDWFTSYTKGQTGMASVLQALKDSPINMQRAHKKRERLILTTWVQTILPLVPHSISAEHSGMGCSITGCQSALHKVFIISAASPNKTLGRGGGG
jgi:hypothetical protein